MRTKILIFGFLILNSISFGQFAPAAGQLGSTAIHKDSSAIVAWATEIQVQRGYINVSDPTQTHEGSNYATFGVPYNALGPAAGNSFDVLSLGDGGTATLRFALPIVNGTGPDFCIFENGLSDTYLELAFVEVSSDGERFVRFPSVSLTPSDVQVGPFGSLDATKIHNLAGKYRVSYGTPFNLEDLTDSASIDINNITHVRVIDVVGSIDPNFATFDSQGNIINELFPTPFYSGGFDLDAVGVIHQNDAALQVAESHDIRLRVFPNPNHGLFYLSINSDIEIENLQITSINGQLIIVQFYADTSAVYMPSDTPEGIYFLQIQTNHGLIRERILISK